MLETSSVKWIDMVDSIYTLCALAGVDTNVNNITGISIVHNRIIIWYIDSVGTARHISKGYSF
jgi:hypothetical protein